MGKKSIRKNISPRKSVRIKTTRKGSRVTLLSVVKKGIKKQIVRQKSKKEPSRRTRVKLEEQELKSYLQVTTMKTQRVSNKEVKKLWKQHMQGKKS